MSLLYIFCPQIHAQLGSRKIPLLTYRNETVHVRIHRKDLRKMAATYFFAIVVVLILHAENSVLYIAKPKIMLPTGVMPNRVHCWY